MDDTDWYCPEDKTDRLAMLYLAAEGQAVALGDMARASTHWPRILGGGGGLLSTAGDYNTFMSMLLAGGELRGQRFVSPRTLALMTTNHLSNNRDLASVATDSYAEPDYAGIGYGLGFSVVVDSAANQSLVSKGTFGWGGAASTIFWVDPLEGLSVGFYTQLLPTGTYPLRRELQQLIYSSLT